MSHFKYGKTWFHLPTVKKMSKKEFTKQFKNARGINHEEAFKAIQEEIKKGQKTEEEPVENVENQLEEDKEEGA